MAIPEIENGQHRNGNGSRDGRDRELTEPRLRAWLEHYGRAWRLRDPAAAAGLFSNDGSYEITPSPFGEPLRGQRAIFDYWRSATSDEREVSFEFDVLSVADGRGIVHWWATIGENGNTASLDGVFVVTLTREGRCSELREWWRPGEPASR